MFRFERNFIRCIGKSPTNQISSSWMRKTISFIEMFANQPLNQSNMKISNFLQLWINTNTFIWEFRCWSHDSDVTWFRHVKSNKIKFTIQHEITSQCCCCYCWNFLQEWNWRNRTSKQATFYVIQHQRNTGKCRHSINYEWENFCEATNNFYDTLSNKWSCFHALALIVWMWRFRLQRAKLDYVATEEKNMSILYMRIET